MKTLNQMLRQPLKTLLGLLLLTLAAAILCVTVGQFWAANSTKEDLDRKFSTVAIPSRLEDVRGIQAYRVDQEILDFLDRMAQEYPNIVKAVMKHGVLSASIPELRPYSKAAGTKIPKYFSDYMTEEERNIYIPSGYGAQCYYDSAMLVFTLEEVVFIREEESYIEGGLVLSETEFISKEAYEAYINASWTTKKKGYTMKLKGTVTQVLSLEAGWDDPVGRIINLTVTSPNLELLEELNLEVGGEYIAYGMDYYDDYKYLVTYMAGSSYHHVDFYPYDPALLRQPTQQEIDNYKEDKDIDAIMLYDDVPLVQWQVDSLYASSMTVELGGGLTEYQAIRDENGTLIGEKPVLEVTYTDQNGESITVDKAQLYETYTIPTLHKLTGSAEDFLSSAEGESWQRAMERDEINNHAFVVYGVEDIDHLAAFALEQDKISAGREFTAEEIESGVRVCIIHELIAQNSGLQVGDTITLSFYGSDPALPWQKLTKDGVDLLRPAATLYFDSTPILETAEYTIVGLWQGDVWPVIAENSYRFSGNTVFVPRSSVQARMENRNNYLSHVGLLENGTIAQFHELAQKSGFAGMLKYTDQDYSKIATNFHNYDSQGKQMLAAGAVIYALLLILFLLLFPASMHKAVATMQSLGVPYGKRFFHVLLWSMAIVVPSAVLGAVVGQQVWHHMAAFLQSWAESAIALELKPQMLMAVSAAQLALALLLSLMVALVVARPRNLSSRR